jgi:periplasmic copper chaperone A
MKKHHHRSLVRTACSLAALALFVPVLLAGCGNDDKAADTTTTTAKASGSSDKPAPPKVSDVWARPGTVGGNSAIYMSITAGAEEDRLTKVVVPTDVAASADLHETTTEGSSTTMADGAMSDGSGGSTTTAMAGEGGSTTTMAGGMMGMQPVDEITIPPGETLTLKPGGYHVMVMDLKKDLKAGDTIPVTLTFAHSGDVDVTATVREP